MPGGRPPKPSHLKLVTGNPGKRKVNKREPKPPRGVPKMPAGLSASARAAWSRIAPDLERMGVLTVADGVALELMCEAYADWMGHAATIAAEGATYETHGQNGRMVRPHPEVAMASDAWRRVQRMLVEFGLTPSSRSKVTAGPEEAADPFAAFMDRGKSA